jgi:hypothetical protein
MPARLNSRMTKFMAALSDEMFQVLLREAKSRGISVQELLRAIIIPDWIKGRRTSNLLTNSQITRVPRAYVPSRNTRTPFLIREP